MKKKFHKLALLFTCLLIPFSFSNCGSDKKTERDKSAMYQEMGEDKINDVQEAAILLGMKHEISINEVKMILYEYYKEYDNYDYQLLTTHTLDIHEWKDSWKTEHLPLSQFIKYLSKSFAVTEKIVAGIILDYRFLKYQEEFEILDSSIEDLKYDLENSQ